MTVELSILHNRLQELKQFYQPLRNRWQEDHEFYAGTFKVELPEGAPKRIPATGRNAVDIPKSHLISDRPLVKRRAETNARRKSQDDDKSEAFMVAFLQENQRLAETPPLHEGFKLQLLRGGSIRKGPFFNMAKFEKNLEARKIVEPGYLWYDIADPWNTFIDPGPNPRQVFFERSITLTELGEKYRGDPGFDSDMLAGKPQQDRIVLVEWYGFLEDDDDYTTFAAFESPDFMQTVSKNQPVGGYGRLGIIDFIIKPRKSFYRYLPARIMYSGYGFRSEGGAPEDMWEGIINTQVKSMLRDQAQARSLASAFMSRVVWGRWQTHNLDSLNAVKLDPNSATVSYVPSDVVPMPAEPVPTTIFENEDKTNARLEEALFSGVVAGQRPKGVDTASGLALLSGTGRLKFGAPLGMAQNGIDNLLFDLCLLLEDVQEMYPDTEFEMRGCTLKARQLHGDYAFSTELQSEDAADKNQRITTGLQLSTSPYAPSLETVWTTFFGIEDVSAELKRKLKGDIILSPEFQQIVKDFLGLAKFKVAEQAQATGAPQQSNMDVINYLNSLASMARAGQPGAMVQNPSLPGSVGAMAAQATEAQAMGPGGNGQGAVAPGWA